MPERDIEQEVRDYRIRQKYNPIATEKVEGNLRFTKVRRIIDWPIARFKFHAKNG